MKTQNCNVIRLAPIRLAIVPNQCLDSGLAVSWQCLTMQNHASPCKFTSSYSVITTDPSSPVRITTYGVLTPAQSHIPVPRMEYEEV